MLYESNQIWVETAFKLGTVAVNHCIQYPENISTRLIYFNSAWEIFTYEFIKQTWQLQMYTAVLMQKSVAALFSVIHDPWYFFAVTDRWKCQNVSDDLCHFCELFQRTFRLYMESTFFYLPLQFLTNMCSGWLIALFYCVLTQPVWKLDM